MSDLVAFVAARLDEDEAAAKAAVLLGFRRWFVEPFYDGEFLPDRRTQRSDVWGYTGFQVTGNGAMDTLTADHIARHDPARVLREVAAKRELIELAGEGSSLDWQVDSDRRVGLRDTAAEPYIGDLILRAMASAYSDHPDFDPAWAAG